MSEKSDEIPVIIVKKRGGQHGGHHGGAWKVAYADFVTAMMALFIVLWIVGQSAKVKSAVAGYFKDPDVVSRGSGAAAPTDRPAPVSLPIQTEPPQGPPGMASGRSEGRGELERAAEVVARQLGTQPGVSALGQQVTIEVTADGLRLEARETADLSFFDVGTANLKPEGRAVLSIIAREIGKLQHRVVVEGHTDSRRYSREDGYTNFELSAERANAARRVLVATGLGRDQVSEVRGYADTRLRNPADPLDPNNRRISILVRSSE